MRVILEKIQWKAAQEKLDESARFRARRDTSYQMVNLLLSKVYLHVLLPVEAFDLMAHGCRTCNDSRRPSSAIKTKA